MSNTEGDNDKDAKHAGDDEVAVSVAATPEENDSNNDDDDYTKPPAFDWFTSASSIAALDLAPLHLERRPYHRPPGAFAVSPGVTMQRALQNLAQRGVGVARIEAADGTDDEIENDEGANRSTTNRIDGGGPIDDTFRSTTVASLPLFPRGLQTESSQVFTVPVANLVESTSSSSSSTAMVGSNIGATATQNGTDTNPSSLVLTRSQQLHPAVPLRNDIEIAQEVYTGQIESAEPTNGNDEEDGTTKPKAESTSATTGMENEKTDGSSNADGTTTTTTGRNGPYGARLLYTMIAVLVLILLLSVIAIVIREVAFPRGGRGDGDKDKKRDKPFSKPPFSTAAPTLAPVVAVAAAPSVVATSPTATATATATAPMTTMLPSTSISNSSSSSSSSSSTLTPMQT